MDGSITRNPSCGFTRPGVRGGVGRGSRVASGGNLAGKRSFKTGETCIFETALTCVDALSKTEVSI